MPTHIVKLNAFFKPRFSYLFGQKRGKQIGMSESLKESIKHDTNYDVVSCVSRFVAFKFIFVQANRILICSNA